MTASSDLPAEVDVLVVGYGPVGATLACLLGTYGVSTLVIDKAADLFMAPRAIALDNEALRILQMAGLPEGAFPTVPIPQVRLHSPLFGEFARLNTSGTIDGHPKLVTFHQPDLERALRARVATAPSVTAATGVALERFEDDGACVEAELRATDGAAHRVRARYLVGADGASSQVRAAIGQDFRGKTWPEEWLIVDARDVPGGFDHVEFSCDPRRPTPHMVAPGGRNRWEFMLDPGETRAEMESDETIRRLLAPWIGGAEVTIERKAVYRFHARSCERYRVGRVFLAGDAAHITPPFVGQGLVAGLRDAANLAWKLAWVAKGHASPDILDSYDEERRPHATRMIRLARLMGAFVMPRTRVAAALAHGAMKAVTRVPVLRDLVQELHIKPQPAFGQGLFVPGRSRLRRGGMLPQVALRTGPGDEVLSDDQLGHALVLVGVGDDAARHLDADTARRWEAHGGRAVALRETAAWGGAGWCAVVRPDRTVLHDGPAKDADRIVRASLDLLTRGVDPERT